MKPIKHLLTPHRHFFDALVLKNGMFHVVSDFGEGTRMKDIPDEVANLYKSRAHVKALDGHHQKFLADLRQEALHRGLLEEPHQPIFGRCQQKKSPMMKIRRV